MTTLTAPASDFSPLSGDVEEIAAAIWAEFTLWDPTDTLVEPVEPIEPGEPGGLPEGWQIVSRLPHPTFADTDFLLVARAGGGWVIVRHERDLAKLSPYWIDETLGHLFLNLGRVMAEPESRRDPLLPTLAAWLRAELLAKFDLNDPIERAEHLLFALGGDLRHPPIAAR